MIIKFMYHLYKLSENIRLREKAGVVLPKTKQAITTTTNKHTHTQNTIHQKKIETKIMLLTQIQ